MSGCPVASKELRAPIVLDPEDDTLYARMPSTPTDGKFRRGLYVYLLVLGLLTAFALISSRQARDDVAAARAGEATAQMQRDELEQQLEKVLANQEERRVSDEAIRELFVALLAQSEDPEVREAFREVARQLGINPDDPASILGSDSRPMVRAPGGSGPALSEIQPIPRSRPVPREPSTAPSPRRSPSPGPSPSPSPSPSRSPIVDNPDPIPDVPNPLPIPIPTLTLPAA